MSGINTGMNKMCISRKTNSFTLNVTKIIEFIFFLK